MLTGLLSDLAASKIYDFSKEISVSEMRTSLTLFLKKKKSSKNDFYERYLEALIELRSEGKGKEVLNFFKEECIFQAFYSFYYGGKDYPRLDENQLQEKLNHCIASLKVGDDINNSGINPKDEIFHFWKIFKHKINESRPLSDIEPIPKVLTNISKYHQEKAASYFSSYKIDEKIKLSNIYIGLNFTVYPENKVQEMAIDELIIQKVMAVEKNEDMPSRFIIVEACPLQGKSVLCYKLCHELFLQKKQFYFFELRKFNTSTKTAQFISDPFNTIKIEIRKEIEILQEGKSGTMGIEEKGFSFHEAVVILDGLNELKFDYNGHEVDDLINNLIVDLELYSQTTLILTSRLFLVNKTERVRKNATLFKINLLSAKEKDKLVLKINTHKKTSLPEFSQEDPFWGLSCMPFFLTRSERFFENSHTLISSCNLWNVFREVKEKSDIDLSIEDIIVETSRLACTLKKEALKPSKESYRFVSSSFIFEEKDNFIEFFSKNAQEYFAAYNVFFELKNSLPYIPELEAGTAEYEEKAVVALELIYNHFVRYPLTDFGFRCLKSFIDESFEADASEVQTITNKLKRALPVFIKHQFLYEYKATLSSSYPLSLTLKGFSTFWALLKHLSPRENFFSLKDREYYRNSVQDFVDIIKFEKSMDGNCFWDLSFQDLKNVNFCNSYLTKIYFNSSTLDGARFDGSTLDEISFCQASINGASFVRSVFKSVSAESIQSAMNADFTASSFYDTNFANANLRSSILVAVRFGNSNLKGTNFQSADISNGDFSEAYFDESTNLSYTNLSKAILNNIQGIGKPQLSKIILMASEISGIVFSAAVFKDTDLRGKVICNAQLNACVLLDADLSMALLDGTDLSGSKLNMKSNLDRISLISANLSGIQEGSGLEDSEFVNLMQNAKILYLATGLSEKIIAQLKEIKPSLFDNPDDRQYPS